MSTVDAKLAEELRLLLDAAADRAQPWLHRLAAADGGHDSRTCGWCPLCNAMALVSGDRSELAARAAEHAAGLIAVLRAAFAEPEAAPASASEPASGSAPEPASGFGSEPASGFASEPASGFGSESGEEPPAARPRVQHIPVVRSPGTKRTPC
ncbi:hypothetical protein ACQPZF_08820 [Actinosynnema sp. CS-041913]|uniref:hypothetical protein n=1 Tax=Actinosynnema sp. CS-041913 TaxID=3239917 RepID=UPI003D8A735E